MEDVITNHFKIKKIKDYCLWICLVLSVIDSPKGKTKYLFNLTWAQPNSVYLIFIQEMFTVNQQSFLHFRFFFIGHTWFIGLLKKLNASSLFLNFKYL